MINKDIVKNIVDEAVEVVTAEGRFPDPILVSEHLKKKGLWEYVGANYLLEYFNGLFVSMEGRANAEEIHEMIRDGLSIQKPTLGAVWGRTKAQFDKKTGEYEVYPKNQFDLDMLIRNYGLLNSMVRREDRYNCRLKLVYVEANES